MLYIFGPLQVAAGIFFTYLLKNTGRRYAVGFAGVAVFLFLNIAYVSNVSITNIGEIIFKVMIIVALSIPWWLFFSSFIGEMIFAPIAFMISPPSDEAQQDYSKARTHEMDGNYQQAITEYESYFSSKRDYVPLERIGRCYFKMDDTKQCLQYLENAKKELLDKDAKYEKQEKRHQYARLLYLQHLVYKKIKSPHAKKIKDYLCREYADTPFANTDDPQIKNYLEIWTNTTVG
ncbi:tetratricopeptide repeat protein [Candidatus Uabimicrobium amorphum]|uniref:Tetratricopeptide repeat protein n=1 Tax=Uabimicrobium amorphum TaxID=2596890 RepID=A0A5S9IN77_UABAM|nr:hypothetical protein [Candidatus Uabimicrobium amorphum]BBM84824.1 hypothetical protein UABAM_03185 [Candidatus Uabimicrobium amorphum]